MEPAVLVLPKHLPVPQICALLNAKLIYFFMQFRWPMLIPLERRASLCSPWNRELPFEAARLTQGLGFSCALQPQFPEVPLCPLACLLFPVQFQYGLSAYW